jgi:hypothetical protein
MPVDDKRTRASGLNEGAKASTVLEIGAPW